MNPEEYLDVILSLPDMADLTPIVSPDGRALGKLDMVRSWTSRRCIRNPHRWLNPTDPPDKYR